MLKHTLDALLRTHCTAFEALWETPERLPNGLWKWDVRHSMWVERQKVSCSAVWLKVTTSRCGARHDGQTCVLPLHVQSGLQTEQARYSMGTHIIACSDIHHAISERCRYWWAWSSYSARLYRSGRPHESTPLGSWPSSLGRPAWAQRVTV